VSGDRRACTPKQMFPAASDHRHDPGVAAASSPIRTLHRKLLGESPLSRTPARFTVYIVRVDTMSTQCRITLNRRRSIVMRYPCDHALLIDRCARRTRRCVGRRHGKAPHALESGDRLVWRRSGHTPRMCVAVFLCSG
jgi:hypothetical protein